MTTNKPNARAMSTSMSCVTLGFKRDDGDFAVIATLNNNDQHYSDFIFASIVNELAEKLDGLRNGNPYNAEPIVILERQDAPDYVDAGEAV